MEKKNGNGNGNFKKLKFLFVSYEALIGDLAWEVQKEGHDVKYYIHEKSQRDVCDGFVNKCENWQDEINWADVIIFDDINFGPAADRLRKQGKLVVGGSVYTDKLEDDREFGQDEMQKAGMNIIPNYNFTDFNTAIKFVKENPGRYVVKPSGKAQNEKELLFVGNEEDGKDVVEILELYKKNWGNKIKLFQLQKYVSGVEVAIGGFFNGKDFVMPININFEHKRLFPGNIGPSTGEMGCYDDKTEVLTKKGWRYFKDVTYKDEFATLNPLNNQLRYDTPSAIVHYTHHKKLVSIKNRAVDLLITPDHNMFGQEANAYRKKQSWSFVKAKDLPNQFVAPRTAQWKGKERKKFVIPAQPFGHYEGRSVVTKNMPSTTVSADKWLAFLGFWLAEGWTETRGYGVGITQVKEGKKLVVQRILESLPFKFHRIANGWKCGNKQLWSYLRPLGDALTKYIPEEYKQLSPRQLKILFDNMCYGNGNLQKNGFRIYYTSSKKLADDVQEILLKLGRVGIVKSRLRQNAGIGQRKFKTINTSYEVIERIKKTVAWLDKRDTSVVNYAGTVHCVSVPYHTLYVRRMGKPVWCGNTSMFWSKTILLYSLTLEKMKKQLQDCGYVGYFDINTISNAKAVYPLEITARFGYPTINIQMEGMTGPFGEFLYNLASAKEDYEIKTKRGFQIGVVIAAPPFPFTDPAAFKKYSEDALVIFKKPNYESVHICDVKLVDNDWRLAGTSGYALVVTGSGSTMEEARKMAYSRVENIMIPNMFYRTDIGAKWTMDSDRLQTWGYLY